MNEEIWKNTEYDGYMVSNKGRVKSLDRITKPDNVHPNGQYIKGKILSSTQNKHRYESVLISKKPDKRAYVHRLVAKAFLQNPDNKPQVNHKNGNTKDNRVENLEWCSNKANIEHANKILKRWENQAKKLRKCVLCVELHKTFESMKEASEYFGDFRNKGGGIGSAIKNNCKAKGYHWKYIGE